MKKFLLLLTIYTAFTIAAFAQWGTLATDPSGDGKTSGPTYLDGTKLEYRYDNTSDSIWFKVTVTSILNANYGINIIMDVNGGGTTAAWFGSNTSFKYNRVITVWVTSGSSGVIGITDAAGFAAMNYTKLGANNISIKIDAANKEYILGMKRTAIYNSTTLKANVIAGVGSNQYWNDDVPNTGSGNINVSPAVSVQHITAERAGYRIFPNPSTGILNIERLQAQKEAEMHIYNISGQEVYHGIIQGGVSMHTVDITGFSRGVHFLRVKADNTVFVETIIHK